MRVLTFMVVVVFAFIMGCCVVIFGQPSPQERFLHSPVVCRDHVQYITYGTSFISRIDPAGTPFHC